MRRRPWTRFSAQKRSELANDSVRELNNKNEEQDMHNEKLRLLEMLANIPGIGGLDIPIERLPTDAEFSAMCSEMTAKLDAEFQAEIVFDYDAIDAKRAANDASMRSREPVDLSSSKRVTVRVPSKVLAAIRARAKASGTKYQTLLNRTLKSAVAAWEPLPSHL